MEHWKLMVSFLNFLCRARARLFLILLRLLQVIDPYLPSDKFILFYFLIEKPRLSFQQKIRITKRGDVEFLHTKKLPKSQGNFATLCAHIFADLLMCVKLQSSYSIDRSEKSEIIHSHWQKESCSFEISCIAIRESFSTRIEGNEFSFTISRPKATALSSAWSGDSTLSIFITAHK